MYKIWGKEGMYSKDKILSVLASIGVAADSDVLKQAERSGGVKIGKTKLLYFNF